MKGLDRRLEKLEAKLLDEDEPVVLETHSGPIHIPGGLRDLNHILGEVARNGRPVLQEVAE